MVGFDQSVFRVVNLQARAATTDFSKTVGPEVFGESQTGTGFEDEVSTAVYNVGDEDAVEIGPGDFSGDEASQEPPAQRAQAARPVFEDEPTNAVLSSPPEHEFATGGEGVEAPGSIDEEAGPETTEAPGFDVPQDSDPEIEFLPADDGDDTVPPTADLPPPSDRYVDRIVAPSPFAPRVEASEVSGIAAETVVEDEPIIADISEAVLEALGAEENAEVMAAVTGEDDEPAIEVTVAPDLDSDETVPFTPPPQPVMVMGEEDPFGVEEEPFGVVEEPKVEVEQPVAIEPAAKSDVELRSDDNQLHLRLQGTGAVIESGQVREIDIEVPVPGAWVGHRRVTLQLRLTLTPDTEDEDGGNSPS